MHKLEIISLLIILVIGLTLRTYGLNWDQGYHLHPDERAIVMISERIHWPQAEEWPKLLTPESPLNPKFFAYGSFPIYLLKFTGFIGGFFDKTLVQYDKINLLGRVLSALFDTAAIFLIFLLAKNLFSNRPKVPLFSAFFYALAVLPIQLSHFFAVDTILNFLTFLDLLLIIIYAKNPSILKATGIGIITGIAFATKFTAIFLLTPAVFAFSIIFFKEFRTTKNISRLKRFITHTVFFAFHFLLLTFLFMPYAFLDFSTFKINITEQLRMSSDPYVFPFTLQYVNTPAYIYPLQQIFLWGLGPFISILSGIGLTILTVKTSITVYTMILRKKFRGEITIPGLIVGIFCLFYFLILGRSAVKFMRYYLPIYPVLSILAAYFIDKFLTRAKHLLGQHLTLTMTLLLAFISILWPFSFVNVYTKPNTRVTASTWINKNIEEGSVLAVEHWDDRLPISGSEKYNFVEMPMYDPDSGKIKWEKINSNLKKADYIILASNRLYTPLQKLADCSKIKYEWRCYPKTDKYYENLFSGNLGFKKISEFTNYPELSFLNYQLSINDSLADENFTVFDHPKITIFKKL